MDNNQLYDQFGTGFLLTKCARLVLDDYQQHARAMGLTPIQLSIVFCLSHGDCTMHQLCKVLVINKTVACRTLKLLREKNFVFVIPNVQDARCRLYRINQDKWRDVRMHLSTVEQVIEAKMAKVLKKKEKQQLHTLLFAMLTRCEGSNQ